MMQMMTRKAIHPMKMVVGVGAAILLWGLVLAYASSPAWAADTTFTVDRADDPDLTTTPTAGACTAAADDCSLRGAITAANANAGDDTLDFALPDTAPPPVNLDEALPDLSTNIAIEGPGADELTVRRDTGGSYRIFTVTSGSVVSISGITISNGSAAGDFNEGWGGGIYNGGT